MIFITHYSNNQDHIRHKSFVCGQNNFSGFNCKCYACIRLESIVNNKCDNCSCNSLIKAKKDKAFKFFGPTRYFVGDKVVHNGCSKGITFFV